jgi:hypothetical protein
MALIPLTVLRTNNNDYYANNGKPAIKSVVIPEDASGLISAIKSTTTVWSTAAGSLPGGCSISLSRPNDAYSEVIWVAETMPQIQTALSKATNVTNAYATESGTATAHSGGGQGSAVLLTKYFTTITTAGSADSVKLPLAASNVNVVFAAVNTGGTPAALAVFPSTGDIIDNNSANASVTVAAGAIVYFWSNGVQWYSVPMVS